MENHERQNGENLLTNHYRNLDACIPIRFTLFSCKRQYLTQPFQCDLQPALQETNRTTHTGTTISCKTHRRHDSRTKRPRTDEVPFIAGCSHFTRKNIRFRAPASSPQHVTFMHPFQCDLQPALQETHRTTYTGTTISCKTHRRNDSRTKRPQPHPSHRRGIPFIAGCSHFTRKNTRFRAPASSPQHSPCNIHAPIPMRSATTASRNA